MSTPSKRGPKKWPKWKAYLIYTSDEFGTNSRGGWRIYPSQLDAMAERTARAIYANGRRFEPSPKTWTTTWEVVREAYRRDARAALKSIGLVAKKGKL